MTKKELIESISFGESIAELEAEKLKDYFFKTEYWRLLRNDSIDVIYGAKGAGKSALYTSITNDVNSLFDENTLVALAENPTGNTAFSNLKNDPPTTETEFVRLWKVYFLVITAKVLDEYEINDSNAKKVKQILIDCNLIPAQNKLASFLKACFDFVKSFRNGKEVSTTAEFDPLTGMYSGQKFSVAFGEPSKSDFDKGLIPIEYVYDLLSSSLKAHKIRLWIIIDRLDVAFLESEDLETNALRALFKTYLDLSQFAEIKLKIFLRDDIWARITNEGFREGSHITKFQNITWSKEYLLNLLIRRVLDNNILVQSFELNKEEILLDIHKQEELFYRLFPKQIDNGAKKPATLDWMLSRTRDGKGINTPRELIQLLSYARNIELKRLENGINELLDDNIISRQSFKEAVPLVSKQRIEQTLYAEYPTMKEYIEKLKGDKAEHNISTLSQKWGKSEGKTVAICKRLESIGFFEVKGELNNPKFKIPFIYRPYLEITQGVATSEDEE
ncbi:MAG: P-loop ATPase, Sll1717 family [Ginsengibacter sp.]